MCAKEGFCDESCVPSGSVSGLMPCSVVFFAAALMQKCTVFVHSDQETHNKQVRWPSNLAPRFRRSAAFRCGDTVSRVLSLFSLDRSWLHSFSPFAGKRVELFVVVDAFSLTQQERRRAFGGQFLGFAHLRLFFFENVKE